MKRNVRKRARDVAVYGVSVGAVFTAGLVSVAGALAIMRYTPTQGWLVLVLLLYATSLVAVVVALRSLQTTREVLELNKDIRRPYLKVSVRYEDERAYIALTNVGEGPAYLKALYTRSELERPEAGAYWIRNGDVYYHDIKDLPLSRGEMCQIEVGTVTGDDKPFSIMQRKLKKNGEKASYISSVSVMYLDTYRRPYCHNVIYEIRQEDGKYRVDMVGARVTEGDIERIHEQVFRDAQLQGVNSQEYVKWEQKYVENESGAGVRQFRKTFEVSKTQINNKN